MQLQSICSKLFHMPICSIRFFFLSETQSNAIFNLCCFKSVLAGQEPEHNDGLTYWCSIGGIYPRRWQQWSGCWQGLSWNPGNRESGNLLSHMASTCVDAIKTQCTHCRSALLHHNISPFKQRPLAHLTDIWLWQHIDLWLHQLW